MKPFLLAASLALPLTLLPIAAGASGFASSFSNKFLIKSKPCAPDSAAAAAAAVVAAMRAQVSSSP